MLGGTRLPRFQAREAAGAPNIFSNNHYVRLPRHALARAARPIHAKTPSRSFGDPGLPRLQAPPPPLPLRLHRKVRYLSPAIRAAAAGEVARRLTSRSHPHMRGLRRRRKDPNSPTPPWRAPPPAPFLRRRPAPPSMQGPPRTRTRPKPRKRHTSTAIAPKTFSPLPAPLPHPLTSSSSPPLALPPPPHRSQLRRRRWRGGPKADLAQPPAQARAEAATQTCRSSTLHPGAHHARRPF